MADEMTQVATSGGPASEMLPATQTTEALPSNPAGGETPQADQFDRARAEALIAKLRSEAAANEKLRREAEAKIRQHEEATLSEQERKDRKLAEYETENARLRTAHQQAVITNAVERQAARLGIVDPEAAARLMDWAALEYDEDGKPTNTESVLSQLIEAKPYLKAQAPVAVAQPQTLPANPARTQAARVTHRASDIGDRKYYLANKADIELAAREGRITTD